ncbi:MAG: hypothetical protein JNL42_01845 [Anaerolineae bacterium]|nr:hypothetical protein [Anaerolineae bacterium]
MRRPAFLVLLLCLVTFAALLIPDAQAEIGGAQEPPYEPTYSYTYEPPIYETPAQSQLGSGGPTDGRLNYVPDEYYTVYCSFDFLEIWRGVPTSLLLDAVPISLMLSMPIGDTLLSAGGITVERSSEDIYTVYGSNGNLAPSPGAKEFSMSECISRNGGAPPEDSAPPAGQPPAQSPVEAFCATEAGRQSESCYSSTGAWCAATNYLSTDCIGYSFSRFLGYLVAQIFQCASQGLVGIFGLVFAAGGMRWYARRK